MSVADAPRQSIYARLLLRNRLVGTLRVVVPALAAAVLVYLLAVLGLGMIGQQLSVASISIDRDQLMVEAPRLSVTGDDGSVYEASAREARISAKAADTIDLRAARLVRAPPNQAPLLTLTSPTGTLRLAAQYLTLPEETALVGSDGMVGTIGPIDADLGAGLYRTGALALRFADGATLLARSGQYDTHTGQYTFTGVEVTLPMTPGETQQETAQ
jgi:hypothetical protein